MPKRLGAGVVVRHGCLRGNKTLSPRGPSPKAERGGAVFSVGLLPLPPMR
jgi:hypothetical protein